MAVEIEIVPPPAESIHRLGLLGMHNQSASHERQPTEGASY
jgi:hypothetical protein